MALVPGKMYRPTDIAVDVITKSVFVVEQFNHRISKWVYLPGFFTFSLANGNVTSLTIDLAGTGYTTAFLVIDGPTGTATANAIVSAGAVTNITIIDGGSGYTTTPNVEIVAVEGSGATATAVVSNGSIIRIEITNGGTGYLTGTQVTPIVFIDAPDGKSRAIGGISASGGLTNVILEVNGNGYTDPFPFVSIVANSGGGGGTVTSETNDPWGNNGDGTTGVGAPVSSTTDNALDRPTGIVFDSFNPRLYVTDTFHNRIRTMNPINGAFLSSVGTAGFGDTNFYHPAGIVGNNAGSNIVIADELNHRALNYTAAATPIFSEILEDPSVGGALSFIRPHGMTFDDGNDEYHIGDSIRSVFSEYDDSASTFGTQFGTPGTTGTDLYYPGSGHGLLGGTLLSIFADTRNNSIKIIDNANTIANFSNSPVPGPRDAQLYYPESAVVFVDGDSYVLVANTRNNRVEVYSNSGTTLTFRANFGSP